MVRFWLLATGDCRKCLEASFVGEGSRIYKMLLSPSPRPSPWPGVAPIGLEGRCPRARPPSRLGPAGLSSCLSPATAPIPTPTHSPPPPPAKGLSSSAPPLQLRTPEPGSARKAAGRPAAAPPGVFALAPGATGALPSREPAGAAALAEVEPSPRPSRASRASKRSSSCLEFFWGG